MKLFADHRRPATEEIGLESFRIERRSNFAAPAVVPVGLESKKRAGRSWNSSQNGRAKNVRENARQILDILAVKKL